MSGSKPATVAVPVIEEELVVEKKDVETGRLRISLTTETVEDVVQETLRGRRAVVDRVPVGREVQESPRVREEDGVVVIPVIEEILVVERRQVDQPLSAADDAFRERTIEAVEHAEKAVVFKEARVREELVIRKDVEQHQETVPDTVRRTEVQINDDRTAGSSAGPRR